MTYLDRLTEEGIESRFLVIINPRRKPDAFTLVTGAIYKVAFDHGEVVAFDVEGTGLTLGSSTSLSAGEFFYDVPNEDLYVRLSDDSDPDLKTTIATYEIHVSTDQVHWYKDPLDNTTRFIYYEPLISENTFLRSTLANDIFGFLQQQTSTLQLSNTPQFWQKHVYDSSWNKIDIKIYHSLGNKVLIEDTKLIFEGLGGDLQISDSTLRVGLLDRADNFNNEFRNSNGESFFDDAEYTNLDPNKKDRPIPYVYGLVDGFVPVNINQVTEDFGTSDNRNYVCIAEQTNLPSISHIVASGSTTTVTKVDNVAGLYEGDSVHFDRVSGTDEYLTILSVDYGLNEVTHDTLTGGAMVSGDSLKRPFVGRIDIIQSGERYTLYPTRDYTVDLSKPQSTSGFDLVNNFEANVSLPNPLSANDEIFCRIYGKTQTGITLDGNAFGADDTETGNLTQGIVVLLDILKTNLGLAESQLLISAWEAVQSSVSDAVGFSIPRTSSDKFPTYKEIIIEFIRTSLLKIYYDFDSLLAIEQQGPHGASDKTIEDDEKLENTVNQSFVYTDVYSDIRVEYFKRERAQDSSVVTGSTQAVKATSDNAKYLHIVNKEFLVESLHFKSADAQVLADRLSYILGDRKSFIKFNTKNRFFDVSLQDIIQVDRERLATGEGFIAGTNRSDKYTLIRAEKSLRTVQITADDQKGIEDNSGSW